MLLLGSSACFNASDNDSAQGDQQVEAAARRHSATSSPIDNCRPGDRNLEIFNQFPHHLIVFPITLIEPIVLEEDHWVERNVRIDVTDSKNFFEPLRAYKSAARTYYSRASPEQFKNPEFQISTFRKFFNSYDSNLKLQSRLLHSARQEPAPNHKTYGIIDDVVANTLIAVAINATVSSGDDRYFQSAIVKIFGGYRSYNEIGQDLPATDYPSSSRFEPFKEMHRRFLYGQFDDAWRIATMRMYLELRPELARAYYSRVAQFGHEPEVREDGTAFLLRAEFNEQQIDDMIENGICQYSYRRAVWDYLFYSKSLKSNQQDVNIDQSRRIYDRTIAGNG